MARDPGPGIHLACVPLEMTLEAAFGGEAPEAYERLLMDVVRGDQTLFMRRDEVEAAWAWIDPLIASWKASGEPPLPYPAGSWGPEAANALLGHDGRRWHHPLPG
jgi:glucose-6-phosphate 1-dehydrogenase